MKATATIANTFGNHHDSRQRSTDCDVAIVGAGPYGLSAGTHLKAMGLDVRVYGQPMEFWATKMPEGMLLRSPRAGSNISDPKSAFTLDRYEATCDARAEGPIALKTFVEYGRWFQSQLGSSLDTSSVAQVSKEGSLFRVELQNGTTIRSRRVVVAAGIQSFQRKPRAFAHLPSSLVSHCYEGRRISDFTGRRVAVIGAGQSALESAALLHEAGADVEVIARIPALRWIGRHGWLHRLGPLSKILYSKYDVGPLGISRLVASPSIVSTIPLVVRDRVRTRAVRSAGARWLPKRLSSVKVSLDRSVRSARMRNGEAQLELSDGSERHVDHVLLGTGYDVDISRYDFISSPLMEKVRCLGRYPDLQSGFSCSVPGLHFIGATAARSFGPLLYFVAGTEFASKELAAHIRRNPIPVA